MLSLSTAASSEFRKQSRVLFSLCTLRSKHKNKNMLPWWAVFSSYLPCATLRMSISKATSVGRDVIGTEWNTA